MKKFFFFAAAAMTMLASCHKNDLVPDQNLDDNSQVAIQLGMNAPSITVTKTKAAVDDWNNNTVFVYGLKQERTNGVVNGFGTMYNLTATTNILNYEVIAPATDPTSNTATLNFYQQNAAGQDVPYYYSDGQTYDFFGYHLGGAEQGTVTAAADVVSFPVTFDGSNDVMYAYADKAEDLKSFRPKGGENGTVADLYSSWAVRRNVQPTLVFNHALTRFNFIVKGQNEKANTVQIQTIEAETVTTGTLTVVGQLTGTENVVGFVADADAEEATVTLLDAADEAIAPSFVTSNTDNVPYGGAGASLMVAPNMEALPIVVTMKNQVSAAEGETPAVWSEPYTYEFSALAANVVKDGNSAGITTFAPGTAYNIYINVYGPEEIVVTAELVDWVDGGDYTYDPDEAFRPGSTTPVEPETPKVTATYDEYHSVDGMNVWTIEAADDVTLAFAGVSTTGNVADATNWTAVNLTTKAQEGSVEFNKNLGNFLHVKYTTSEEATTVEDCTENEVFELEVTEPEEEEDPIQNLQLNLVYDQYSYENYLYEAYVAAYPWETQDVDKLPLPWLSVMFDDKTEESYSIRFLVDVWDDEVEEDVELPIVANVATQLNEKYGATRGYVSVEDGVLTVPAGYFACGGVMFDNFDLGSNSPLTMEADYIVVIKVGDAEYSVETEPIAC